MSDVDDAPGEEVTRRNVLAIRDYTVLTRQMVKDLAVRVDALVGKSTSLQQEVDGLHRQMAVFKGEHMDRESCCGNHH